MSDISVVMGSKSDWPTVKETCDILDEFGVSYRKECDFCSSNAK